jgi:adenine-specific DNA-methyltransferase
MLPSAVGASAERLEEPDNPLLRKERGAFFTPARMSGFLVDWAVRGPADRVLEPSCGEASFLLPAAARLRSIGATCAQQLHGVEVHAASAAKARKLVEGAGVPVNVRCSDFFDVEPDPTFDVVVGNPPYIRYQQFAGDGRAKSLRAALAAGVRLTRLASSWAAFTVHASRFLKPSGRLGLVLPAELLTVNYAAPVRRFLLKNFAKVRLVMFEKLVFPGVLEEVVLLMAEGFGGAEHFEVFQATDLDDLGTMKAKDWSGFTPEGGGKWTGALLPGDAFSVYRSVVESPAFSTLSDWGETSLGAVTGNNNFFALSAERVRELGIAPGDLCKISPPGSRHLRGLMFSEAAWEAAARDGSPCYLFYPKDKPSAGTLRYIEHGEKLMVHRAYKCEVRSPWWRVPLVGVPDLLMTYMDQQRPRLVTNEAGVAYLNSLYGVTLRQGLKQLGGDLLPVASLNSATLLGSEVVGRSYGGGMLKLEPKEADVLPLPSPDLLRKVGSKLRALRPQLAVALRNGRLHEAAAEVDKIVLADVSNDVLGALRSARELLFARRTTRGKGNRGTS